MNSRAAWGSVALVAALALAGCTPGGSTPSETTTADDAGVVAAAEAVAGALLAQEDFVAPGPAFDASGAEGKVVYYIPAAAEVQVFNQTRDFLKDAFEPFGITFQECAGQGASPTSIANCLSQAEQAGADAIITMSVPYQLASSAFDSVIAAGIPVVLGLIPDGVPAESTQVGYFAPNLVQLQRWNADWTIANSEGTANVIVIQEDANPSVQSWTTMGTLPEYEDLCSGCTVAVVGGDVTQQDKLASDVTSKFVADTSVEYVQTVSGNHLPAVIKGLQAAGLDTTSVKVSVMDSDLSTMTLLSQGQWIGAVSGWSVRAGSWYLADQALRLLSGEPAVENAPFPYLRLFTEDNLDELELTPEAAEDGSWFGPTNYEDGFRELWGLN